MTSLGDIAQVIDCEHRTAPRASEDPYGFSVGTRAVRNGRISIADAKPVSKETYVSWTRRATPAPEDLIFSREAPMGEVGAVPADTSVCLGQRTVLLRLNRERVDQRYLLYLLLAPQSQAWISANAAGSTVPHLNVADVRKIPIPLLPSLDEQLRIVDLLEDHLSRLDAAAESVHVSLRRLDALRHVVVRNLATGGAVALKQLAVDSGYGTSVKCEENGAGPAVVRIPNLVNGRVDLTDEKRAVDPRADLSSAMLTPGDVLIIRTNGSKDLIGRSGVVQEGVDAAFASYLIRYRVDTGHLRPEWLHTMLASPGVRAEIERLAASSAGQHNLSLGKLDRLQIPTPSLAEQDAGLARLAELDGQAGLLRRSLDATLLRGVRLRRALLAAAFSGRLTGQTTATRQLEELAG